MSICRVESNHLNKVFIILLMIFPLFGCGVSDDELIQSAIEYSYPNIYGDLSDLRQDYPGFTPVIKKWNGSFAFLLGAGRYYVTMPEEAAIISSDGKAKTSRNCVPLGSHNPLCILTAPKVLELGITGTIQLDEKGYPPAKDFTIEWEGKDKGEVYIREHCFYAYKRSDEPLILNIRSSGFRPLQIKNRYGTRLVAITLSANNYHSSIRIPKNLFLNSNTCSPEIRESWPNVGGWAWKR